MSQTTIVFVHGAGISSWMWRQQVEGLTAFSTIAVSLPGHVGSDRPWTTVAEAATVVAEVIRNQVPGGKAHVVGLSLGGVVGLELLAQAPDTVDRMVLSGTLAVGLPGARFLAGLAAISLPLATLGPMARLSARMMGIPPSDYASLQADIARLDAGPLRQMVLDVASYRPPPALAERSHRVLVVAGSKEHPRIRRSVGVLTGLMPGASGAVIPGGIHTWNWQFPDQFNQLVTDWIDRAAIANFAKKST